jgi:menaquinone-dependent protoporphyrinogen oxidase
MRVLVTWGSKRGGTAGIGRMLGEALEEKGLEVVATSVDQVKRLDNFDAVIVGGALYGNRWAAGARRFVNRHVEQLRHHPVWFFSSGPLDDSADRQDIPAPSQITILAERVGAKGHVTFGGRLERDARGFPARAMAKTSSGDWRNPQRIRAWASELAAALPTASPGTPVRHAGRSLSRLLANGFVGWLLWASAMAGLLRVLGAPAALVVHAILAPLIFGLVARHYFRARGARDPLPTAITWTALVVLLDLVLVAGFIERSLARFGSLAGTWLPLALVFLAIWVVGVVMSSLPWPKAQDALPPPTQPWTKDEPGKPPVVH